MQHPSQRPLQPNNSNTPPPHKTLVTFKDQRIEEIKKKYDTPSRRNKENGKENKAEERTYRSVPRAVALTEAKEKIGSAEFFAGKGSFNSMGRCVRDRKAVEISSFGLHADLQGEKAKTFSGLQNLHFKPAISSKLKANQTDQYFFKPKPQQSSDLVPGIRCKQSYGKLNRRETNDSRIDNIGKINSKIKQLLQCIDDCERQELNQDIFFHSKVKGPNNMRRSGNYIPETNNHSCQLQQTKIIERQSIFNNSLAPTKTRSRERMTTQIPSLSEMRASHPTNQFSDYLTSYKNKLKQQENESLRRSRMDNQKPEQREAILRDKYARIERKDIEDEDFVGPKVELINQEITQFQQKINELQEQKRKFNSRLKPYYFENSPIKDIHASHQAQIPNKVNNLHQRVEAEVNFFARIELRESRKAAELLEAKQEEQQRLENEARNYDNIQLRKKIGERMEERRKRIEMFQQDTGNRTKETCQLVTVLCEQVKLDQQLRNSKNWFSECNNPQKLSILHHYLQQKHSNFTLQEVNHIFTNFRSDQSDPFFSFREEKYTIELVAQAYLRCIKHWKQKVCHKWSAEQLSLEDFSSNFSSSNKASVLIEDIVRLLNTQTGSFYRNRDVYLIYERIRTEIGKAENQRFGVADLLKVFT